MKPIVFSFSIFASLASGMAIAAPISADSDLMLFHDYTVNSGSVPQGLSFNIVPGTLVLSSSADSQVDDPAASQINSTSAQVGNAFATPPIPFLANRLNRTTINAGAEGAEASYNVSITQRDDPDADPLETSIVERTVDVNGSARAGISSAPIAADAMSQFENARGYSFENTTNSMIAFNIVGEVRASLSADYNGEDGFARASGTLFLRFEDLMGASVSFLPISPYSRTIDDSDPGASITESLMIGSSFGGFDFSASATALGNGGDTSANFDATFRYLFGVSIDAGGSLVMRTGHTQVNAVEYNPVPGVVPLPAGIPLLCTTFIGLAMLRRRGPYQETGRVS